MTADWTPDLTLNHALLDQQHVELFRRITEVGAALDRSRAEVELAVAALANAIVDHLATEERIMEETLYPERVRHRSAHELFLADFMKVREALCADGPTPSVAEGLRVRIPEWLRFHIRVNDLPLGHYLSRRQKGGGRPRKDDGRRLS